MNQALGTLSITLRPKTLDQVIGNASVVAAIRMQLDSNRLPIAWLFAGPPGTGKTSLAEIVASMLGAEERIEINGASFGVEDARQLVKNTEFRTFSGRPRIVIINEMQDSTAAAQEELLVPFEKSTTTVFLLTTTNPNKITKALRDRCLPFYLTGLTLTEIVELLNKASTATGASLDYMQVTQGLDKAGINSPREILMVVERLAGGMSIEEATQSLEGLAAEYFEIAKAVMRADWGSVSAMLSKVKPIDTLAVRGVVTGYMKSVLLKQPMVTSTVAGKPDLIAECIQASFRYTTPFQDGTLHAGTIAWLYGCCRRLRSAQ